MAQHGVSQLEVPASFVALFAAEGGSRFAKPTASAAEIGERHEFCEDLAQALVESSRRHLFDLQVTEIDVLQKVLAGLHASEEVVSTPEARWVVRRLAELLDWQPLDLDSERS